MTFPVGRLGPFVAILLCMAVAPDIATGQFERKASVSPVAPPTMKAPVFNTIRPDYPKVDRQNAAGTVVAEVDGRAITLGEVGDAIRNLPAAEQRYAYPDLFNSAVSRLVRVQALVIAATAAGLDADPVVQRRIKAATDDILATQYLLRQSEKQVTEQDLLKRYAAEYSAKPGPTEIRLRVMVLPTEAIARSALDEVLSGADFAATAKQVSLDATAANGGDFGYVTGPALRPEILGVALATAPGRVVPTPIASDGKWLVVKVEDKRNQPPPPFAVVREALLGQIMRENGRAIADDAVKDRTIREFSIGGKESDAIAADSVSDQ